MKYRAWDERYKKMMLPIDIFNAGDLFYENDIRGSLHLRRIINRDGDREELKLMVGTGVIDRNGIEIFEGDKISYKNMKGIVEFFSGAFFCSWGDQTDDMLGYLTTTEVEITGNIYENKHEVQSVE